MTAFLKLNGTNGQSTDDAHKDQIEIHGFSIDCSQQANVMRSTQSQSVSSGNAMFSPLSFSTAVEKSTPLMFKYCAEGTKISDATIEVIGTYDGKKVVLIKIELKDCYIGHTSLSQGEAAEQGSVNISLGYGQIKLTYTPVSSTGPGGKIEFDRDLSKAAA